MKEQFLYVGQYVHTDQNIDMQALGLNEKKIGYTDITPEGRSQAIINVNSTIRYGQVAAWKINKDGYTARGVEGAIHKLLAHDRKLGPDGERTEFFDDKDNTLIARIAAFIAAFDLGEKYELSSKEDTATYSKAIATASQQTMTEAEYENLYVTNPNFGEFYTKLKEEMISRGYYIHITGGRSYITFRKQGKANNVMGMHWRKTGPMKLDMWFKEDQETCEYEGWDIMGKHRDGVKASGDNNTDVQTIANTIETHYANRWM